MDTSQSLTSCVTAQARPLLVLVSGPWSSGTSAVAGMLDALGLHGLPPHARTVDERTPNCYESIEFRRLVLSLADEDALRLKASRPDCVTALSAWARTNLHPPTQASGFQGLYLKFPLAALLLPAMVEAWSAHFDIRHVFVLRSLHDIEATRLRRNWKPVLGQQGAQVLYSQLFSRLLNQTDRVHLIRFHELLQMPDEQLSRLVAFLGLDPTPSAREAALQFLRPAPGASPMP